MKAKFDLKTSIFAVILCAFVLCAGTFIFAPSSTNNTFAQSTYSDSEYLVSNSKFKMQLSPNARKNTVLPTDVRTVTTTVGDKVTYYCFKWSELEYLHFKITSQTSISAPTFKTYKFVVTNVQDDNLTTSIGVKDPKVLYQGNFSENNFSSFDFNYYIDKDAEVIETPTKCKGNDFGLYKFDFVYTYTDDGIDISVSVGEMYIAVLPDNIDDVDPANIQLLYSVSSSNRLMNVFNLYLSTNAYDYVNPKYITWSVSGKDKDNNSYILTQQEKDANLNGYGNYKVIWQNLLETSGTSFVFDSNDIEGTWTATCTITNTKGEQRQLTVTNLSTIKSVEQSNIWIIFLVLGILLVLGVVIFLIIMRKKRDKVW